MAARKSSLFKSDPIHRPAPNSSLVAADPVRHAAVGASAAGMSGPPGAPPTQQVASIAPPYPASHPTMQGATAVAPLPLQGRPVTSPLPFPAGPRPSMMPPPSPPMMAVQPPRAGTMMAMRPPQAGMMQLLQAADMIARPPLPAGLPQPKRKGPEYSDMPFGPQMTGYEQEMAGCHKSVGVPYGSYIHNEMPSGSSSKRPLPSNASNTLYVEGLPTNCTRRELTHIFRRFTGFCDVRLVNIGFNNRHVIAFVDFHTPAQAFSVMESLQGYMFDIQEPYTHKLRLQFSPTGSKVRCWTSW